MTSVNSNHTQVNIRASGSEAGDLIVSFKETVFELLYFPNGISRDNESVWLASDYSVCSQLHWSWEGQTWGYRTEHNCTIRDTQYAYRLRDVSNWIRRVGVFHPVLGFRYDPYRTRIVSCRYAYLIGHETRVSNQTYVCGSNTPKKQNLQRMKFMLLRSLYPKQRMRIFHFRIFLPPAGMGHRPYRAVLYRIG